MKNVSMLKKQDGFTLIELIVVMVILGVLAALAVPRFIGFTETARLRSLDGARGAVKSAAFSVRSEYVALEKKASGADTTSTIKIDGKDVTVDLRGYPVATTAGICAAVDFDDKFACDNGTNVVTVTLDKANRPNCAFTYAISATENVVLTDVASFSCK